LCREEAAGLHGLRPSLEQLGVPLYAITFQTTSIDGFYTHFQGDMFMDEERKFFTHVLPNKWMGLGTLVSPTFWGNVRRGKGKGFEGDLKGEGRLMGGVLVVGPGTQGVKFMHVEETAGDHARLEDVLAACKQIAPANL